MNKKVILIAGTPVEHSIQYNYNDNKRDFASMSYNYAIASLKANKDIAGDNGYEIELLDYPVNRKMNILNKRDILKILNKSPDIIGFSVYCWNRHIFMNTARYIKKMDKSIKILLGGPSVSYDAEDLLKNNDFLDIVVIGEGEEKFSQLLVNDFVSLEDVDGIVYRNKGVVLKTTEGRRLDINFLSSPYLTINFLPRSDALLIEPSRGCVYRCKFCSWSRDKTLNIKRSEILKDEIKWAYENGYRKINFSDTSINMTNEQLRLITEAIKKSQIGNKLSFSVFMKYEKIDKLQLQYIDGLIFDEMILGLESITPDVLRECGKVLFDKKKLESVIKTVGSMGNKFTISIITGLPYDSIEGIKRTVEYLEGLIERYPDYINFVCSFWLAILPGTRFAKEANKYGFKFMDKGTPYLISSNYISKRDLFKIAEYVYKKTKTNSKFFCEEFYIEVLEKGL